MGVTSFDTAYRLSPMQQGMLLHNLDAPQSGAFVQQTVFAVHGDLDPDSFRLAWERVMDRHAVLRSAFRWEGVDVPVLDLGAGVRAADRARRLARGSRRPSTSTGSRATSASIVAADSTSPSLR